LITLGVTRSCEAPVRTPGTAAAARHDDPAPSAGRPTAVGSRFDRLAVRVLQQLTRHRWGFPPAILRPLVREFGGVRAVRWMVRSTRRYERAERALGPLRTHLACVAISLYNGCRYCAHGHAYAVELLHLERTGRLFPVPALELAGWAGLPRTELRSRLRDALLGADLHVELIWVDRALDLVDGGQPIDDDEARIAHLVSMFDTLNAVGIAGQPPLDEAHDPLNRDAALKARLAELRAAATAS
jgi:hypothetical protein